MRPGGCLAVLLACVLQHPVCRAGEEPALTVDRALRTAMASRHLEDPADRLHLRGQLPEVCLSRPVRLLLLAPAEAEALFQKRLEFTERFFRIDDARARMFAAGERAAAAYRDWQRILKDAAGGDGSGDAAARAEATYLKSLQIREEWRLRLRDEYQMLAKALGDPAAVPTSLELPELADVASNTASGTLPTPRSQALAVLRDWWGRHPAGRGSVQSDCLAVVDRLRTLETAEARARDEATDLRIAFLRDYAVPAAAAAVRLAEADLDRARSREGMAPKLGEAMTAAFLAAADLRAQRAALVVELLRRRGAGD